MTPEKLAFINLIVRLGFDSASVIWKTVISNPTLDDAIAALEASQGKTWDDYKAREQP